MTRQLSKKEAISFGKSMVYVDWSSEQIAGFQLFQEKLCVDFSRFHKALEDVLGRSIYTREFAFADKPGGLMEEYNDKCSIPTLDEIINLIPKDKRLVIFT